MQSILCFFERLADREDFFKRFCNDASLNGLYNKELAKR